MPTRKHLSCVSFSPKSIIAACSDRNKTFLVDVSADKVLKTLPGPPDISCDLTFSPDGSLLATGTSRGEVVIWNVAEGEAVFRRELDHGMIISVAFSSKGDRFVTGHDDGTMILWSIKQTKEV